MIGIAIEKIWWYKCSNSSLLTALNSASMPSGGHTSVTKWLNKAASTEIPFLPGIARVVFDNKQVIGKCYRVKANQSSVPSRVVTSMAYLLIDESNELHYQDTLKPSGWMFNDISETVVESIVQSFNQHNNLLRETRNNLLETSLAALKDTQILIKNEFSDNIDKTINQKNFAYQFKICSQCNIKSPSTNRICKSCKGKLIKPKIDDGKSATEKKHVTHYSYFKNKLTPNDMI